MREKRKTCEELVDSCRNPECDNWFRRDERFLECPECGWSRICGTPRKTGSRYCVNHTASKNVLKRRRPLTTGKESKSTLIKKAATYQSELAKKYDEVTSSGLYLSNQAVLHAVDQRILDLFERLKDNDTPNRVKALIDCWNALDSSFPIEHLITESGDKDAIKAYNKMVHEATKAYHDYESWRQLFEAFDLRRKTSADEMKIWKDAKAMMTVKDGHEMVAQLLSSVITTLKDEPDGQRLITLIANQFTVIIGEADLGNIEGRGPEIIDIHAEPMDRESLLHTGDPEGPGTEGEDTSSSVSEGLPE